MSNCIAQELIDNKIDAAIAGLTIACFCKFFPRVCKPIIDAIKRLPKKPKIPAASCAVS